MCLEPDTVMGDGTRLRKELEGIWWRGQAFIDDRKWRATFWAVPHIGHVCSDLVEGACEGELQSQLT